MSLFERLADLIQKNPRAALNVSLLSALLFVTSFAMTLYRGKTASDIEALAKCEADNKELRLSLKKATFSLDSTIQAGYLQRIKELERNNALITQVEQEGREKYQELYSKYVAQAKIAERNNNLSKSGSEKNEQIINILKNEN